MSTLQDKVIAGTKWTGTSTGVTTFLDLAQLAILARLLDPTDFGLMQMVMVVVGFAHMFADVGIFTHSSHLSIRLLGDHYQEVPEKEKKGYPIAPVKIGRYVFIAAGAKVLPGVTIGDGALIAVGSVVKRNVEPFQIVAGDPAEAIGDTRKLDERYLLDPQLREWY